MATEVEDGVCWGPSQICSFSAGHQYDGRQDVYVVTDADPIHLPCTSNGRDSIVLLPIFGVMYIYFRYKASSGSLIVNANEQRALDKWL